MGQQRRRMGHLAAAVAIVAMISACSPINGDQPEEGPPTDIPATAVATPTPDTSTSAPTSRPPDVMNTAELVQYVEQAVVRVAIASGVGSGFIIDPEGYIVTNHHVVANGLTNVQVTLWDGSIHQADVIGTDAQSDMAILKIDAGRTLHALELAELRDVVVGEDVVAIGFALDLTDGAGPPSVTRGIVSAKNRVIQTRGILGAIQTDTAINHGNSGGPLLNYEGKVIGVNTALAPPDRDGRAAQNIGFAVGADTVDAVYHEIREKGRVDRALLGISNFSSLRVAEARALGLPEDTRGILVSEGGLAAGGPASAAGLVARDVIVRVGEHPVADESDLAVALIIHDPGEEIEVEVYREGSLMVVPVTLGAS